jgi:hypothetical protein
VLRTLRNRLTVAWAALRGHAIAYGISVRGTVYTPPGRNITFVDCNVESINRGQRYCVRVGQKFESNKGASL